MNDITLAEAIAKEVLAKNGRALYVGGYARDTLLRGQGKDIVSKDIDIEVYGITLDELKELLCHFGKLDIVGASFGVIKLHGSKIDISIPRIDSKVGVGHKGFMIDTDPNMSTYDAAKRRDFTINTIAIDVLTGEIIDEHSGEADLINGILRVTDPALFADDPLRVFRAMQFAARFDLKLTEQTTRLCQQVDLSALSAERIGEEWKKLLLSKKPSIGLEVAKNIGVLEKLYPELDILNTVVQDPQWHPEGSVWEHSKLTVDVASTIVRRDGLNTQSSLELLLAALCHDIGKTSTTNVTQDKVTSYGHEKPGAELTADFITKLALPLHYLKSIPKLVENHMFFVLNLEPSDTSLRRLAQRLHPATIDQLLHLAEADILGRANDNIQVSYLSRIRERAQDLSIDLNKTEPLILGRDLISLGVLEGPVMGKLLNVIYEVQLKGLFANYNDGFEYAKKLIVEENYRNNDKF